MLTTLRALRSQQQNKMLIDSDYREGSVLSFQLKSQHVHVEVDARLDVVDVEYQMIDLRHITPYTRQPVL